MTIEESAQRMFLQPPKGRKHDRSSQGTRGEFARLSSALSQPTGSRETRGGDARVSGATTGARKVKGGPAPKRLVKPKLCASPLHPRERESESSPPETGWTQSGREELDDGALEVLAVMESLDDEPFSQFEPPFSRGIRRAESAGAFLRSGEQHAP